MLEIKRSVSISIDEEGIKQLILDKIAETDPSIVVDNINFTQSRKPTRIIADIEAHMESGESRPKTAKTDLPKEEPEVDLDEEEELDPASKLLEEEQSEEEVSLDDEEATEEEEDPFA